MNVLINAIAFKVAWVSAVFGGGANDLPIVALTAVFAAVGIHLWRAKAPAREATLVLIAAAIGLVWDSAIVVAGWVSYSAGTVVSGLAPYWIIAIWMTFATTLNIAFRWLRDRLVLAAAMGAVFGPLSYSAGAAAGAVELVDPVLALGSLSLAWSLLMPGMLVIARRFDGVESPAAQSAPA